MSCYFYKKYNYEIRYDKNGIGSLKITVNKALKLHVKYSIACTNCQKHKFKQKIVVIENDSATILLAVQLGATIKAHSPGLLMFL